MVQASTDIGTSREECQGPMPLYEGHQFVPIEQLRLRGVTVLAPGDMGAGQVLAARRVHVAPIYRDMFRSRVVTYR